MNPRLPFLPFLRTKLARLCCVLVAHCVELMRDGQIKALPRELVTPVCLLVSIPALRDTHEPEMTSSKRSCTDGPWRSFAHAASDRLRDDTSVVPSSAVFAA